MDDEKFVDAQTDLEGLLRTVIAEQTAAMEARLQSWMETKLEKHMYDMREEFIREYNKLLGIANKNMRDVLSDYLILLLECLERLDIFLGA